MTLRAFLRLCDACCDRAGVLKECLKTGGCTCDICGWSCSCVLGGRQFINHIPVGCIPPEGWSWLQRKNEESLAPLDWEALFAGLRSGRVKSGTGD